VLQEVNAAHDFDKTILPVIVNNTVPAANLRNYLATPQQTPWTQPNEVARAIVRLLEHRPASKAS
jgi:hypothetical protein